MMGQRSGDQEGFARYTCWLATRLSEMWDWIDSRDLDKHAVSVVVLTGTWNITNWAMQFAETGSRPAAETAMIIAAVSAPYLALQAAAIAWYFKART